MKKPLLQIIIQKIRELTPLFIRQSIGPIIAEVVYTLKPKTSYRILSLEETLDYVREKNLSLIRFGDGEIDMIGGTHTSFQRKDAKLVERLTEIIKVNDPNLLICIPNMFKTMDLFEPHIVTFLKHQLYKNNYIWKRLLSKQQLYGDAFISRPYLEYKDKEKSKVIFTKLFSLWENKDVVLIEGSKSRLGVGNDMFDATLSFGRILCPAENAFNKYAQILEEASKVDKEKLILLSLGPTAKVLAYDLFRMGYRVLDIGHIDMEYEMFLRNARKQEKVRFKYFNEINERNPEECTDEKYLREIIAEIA